MNAAEKNPMLILSARTLEKKLSEAVAIERDRCARICEARWRELNQKDIDRGQVNNPGYEEGVLSGMRSEAFELSIKIRSGL